MQSASAARPDQTRQPSPTAAAPSARWRGAARATLPGLALTAGAVAIAWGVNQLWAAVSPLTAAVVLGVVATNVLPAGTLRAARPGLQVAAKRVMRAGIVLLGLQLALGDVLHLGWRTLAFVAAVVLVTFFGTQWLGRRLGLPGRQPLLIATGFAICGASAVAAMEGVTRRPGASDDDPDPVVAVALVTLCGSLAILVLPLLRGPLGLTDPAVFGHWVGASVHDVGQVVATAGAGGATAVNGAVVVKLMRVAMLAPMVAGTAVYWRRAASTPTQAPSAEPSPTHPAPHPPLVPLFIAAFLAMIALRTTGVLPASALSAAKQLQDLLLAAGMFGLGSGVRLRELARTGPRPLALGLASWALIAGAAYIGVRVCG
ncbi:MAG: putative sulfate exporter family transporter [Catenulispora sp.]|nr:putative sulfate exporter family transporter [Catenulispora sp.]